MGIQWKILKEYISEAVFNQIKNGDKIPDYLLKKLDFSIFNDGKENIVSVVNKHNF